MKISILLIIIMLVISFKHTSANEYYWYIDSLDNPAPGYLIIDNPNPPEYPYRYALGDNYGDVPYQDTLMDPDDLFYFLPFTNGTLGCFIEDTLLVYDYDMTVIDTIIFPEQYNRDFHDAIVLENGHYLLLCVNITQMDLSHIVENGSSEAEIMSSVLVETDNTGEIYWEWDTLDHLNITDVTDDVNLTMPVIDFTHSNSIAEDEEGNIYLSSRNLDEITKIDKETGDIIWRMGGSSCSNNEFTFIDDDIGESYGFSHQHSITILDNGNMLLFDNGNMRPDYYSRAVEYEIDEENMTATKVWEYRHTPDLISAAMGNVQRLPNGNTFINWSFGTITEVRPDGSVALTVRLTETPIYQAFKTTAKLDVVMRYINSTGRYSFDSEDNHTFIDMNISELSGEGNLSVEKHEYAPAVLSLADSSVSSVLPYRWVARKDSLGDISGSIYMSLYDIIDNLDPDKISIYNRATETSGEFVRLTTNFDGNENQLIAQFSELGEFIVCSHLLEEPSLLFPDNAAQNIFSDTEFSWNRVIGAEQYFFQVSDSEEFNNIKEEIVTEDNFCFINNLENSKQYYWRVYAINSKDSSDWSEVFTFSTKLAEPELIYPDDFSANIKRDDYAVWSSVVNASNYQIQCSKNMDFMSIRINGITTDTTYSLSALDNSTKYYWRVRAYNTRDTSEWSLVRSFDTQKSAPLLLSPNNLETDVPISGFLNWLVIPLAVSYSVEIAKDTSFKTIVISATSITENFYLYDDLEYATNYYWRVKAIFRSDTSAWSSYWTFTTIEDLKLPAPKLSNPNNESDDNEIDGFLTWKSVEGAVQYKLHVSMAKNFDPLLIEEINLSDTSWAYSEFESDSTYYWRVKAFSSVDSSNWSSVWSFTIKEEITLGFVYLLYPFYNSIQIPTDTEFRWMSKENVSKYQLQITDSSFDPDSSLVDSFISDTIFTYSGFRRNETYFWRVRYFTETDTSMWTYPCRFTIEPVILLETPELVYPIDSSRVVPVDIEFKWQRINSEDKYKLECSRYPHFFFWKYYFNEIDSDVYEFSALNYNEKYYWHIMAYNDSSYSEWTASEVFYTELQPPIVIYPDSSVNVVKVNDSIVWDTVDGADRYLIEFAKDEQFDEVILSDEINDKLSYSFSLVENAEYFYRVKAINDSNESQWTFGMLKTENLSDIEDMDIHSDNGKIYPNPAKNELIADLNNVHSKSVNIKIINVLGDILYQATLQIANRGESLERFDISFLNNGIYHFVCEFDSEIIVKKLIVIR